MEKTSKIKSVGEPKEYKNDNGTFYYFQIELEDGTKGSIGGTEQNPAWLKVGEELTFTIEVTDKGTKVKRATGQNKGFTGKGSKYTPEPIEAKFAGFAVSYAKDMVVSGHLPLKELLIEAEEIFVWLKTKVK